MRRLLSSFAIMAMALLAMPAMAMDHGHDGKKSDKAMYQKADKNIVEVAQSKEQFSTLVAAVKAADLVEALSADGELTVFAPTNDAFAALPEGTLETLLQPENKEQLRTILLYHVVPAKVKSKDAVGAQTTLDTLAGQALTVDGTDGVKINNANVVKADVKATNGVIHVIDTVLLP